MCGLAGFFTYADGPVVSDHLERQLHALRHRGPEMAGVWRGERVGLGHQRLPIVDTSPAGRQPIANEDGSVFVVVNGEFYGAAETRARLARRGHAFRSESDSELIVHLWEELGPDAFQHVTGMFAVALFDSNARILVLARDRIGKKPLYWHDDGKRITFASELKALLLDPSVPRDVDESAIVEALTFQYIKSPRSVWRGVEKLLPGHCLVCDSSGPRTSRYWTIHAETTDPGSGPEASQALSYLIDDAVRARLVADVPIGVLLSGGLDSSCVAAFMAAQRGPAVPTFCVGVEGQDDEDIAHARLVAGHLRTDHHECWVGPGALALLPRLVWGLDEPFFDPSVLPTYLVARLARERVTVALSGDGGDEMFGGYDTYRKALRHAAGDWVPKAWRSQVATAARALSLGERWGRLRQLDRGIFERHLANMSLFLPEDLGHLLAGGLAGAALPSPARAPSQPGARRGREEFGSLLAFDAETYLPDDVLAKMDRMSMLNTLEVRAPLLDQSIVAFSAQLPFSWKMRCGVTKWVLRESARRLLPDLILHRRKRGLGLPLSRWMDQGLLALARETLLDGRTTRRGWLKPRALGPLLEAKGPRPARRAHQVFALTCLELWARTYLDRAREDLHAPIEGALELHPAVALAVAP